MKIPKWLPQPISLMLLAKFQERPQTLCQGIFLLQKRTTAFQRPTLLRTKVFFKVFFLASALGGILLYSGCTVKRELTGENDNEVKALLSQITPLLQLQKLSKGLELVNLLNDIQKLTNATTTTETDDAYPGSPPGVSNTTGACYIDNKGGVAGFDLCCYAIIETECANVASVLLTNYDITFVAGANTAAACTGNGFTTAYNSSSFSCYLK